MSAASADLPAAPAATTTRRERRRERKKQRRRRARREAAALARAAAEALAADPEEERRLCKLQEAEAVASERARRAFEDAERRWLEAAAARAAEKAAAAAAQEEATAPEASSREKYKGDESEDGEWEYVEDGPAEIIWQGNEITVKKKKVKVPKKAKDKPPTQEQDRPTSNPLPPHSVAFASQRRESSLSAQEVLEKVAQETPNFGTEQDKAHCPFHLKTGACRFGVRCSRVHFYPDKSCTLLMKNMYNGPGLALEQDEGLEFFLDMLAKLRPATECMFFDVIISEFRLEANSDQASWFHLIEDALNIDLLLKEFMMFTDEEVEQRYEEFYEDVHTEFLKFGEIVNFKVCRNGSVHLRGNVYVHYKSLDSALLAYSSMNGRYFAGKQITCEFVALTRWKAAICGEYLRSRFKTCSHGVACNFIHCFHNPGGDYEWADWDNPPPKYWTRKMAALFGPSDDAVYGKASDTPDFERSRSSDRKRLRSYDDRYISSRSRDDDVHKRHSSRDHSHSKKERSSHNVKYEHSRHRREPCAADKHRGQEIEDDTGKYSSTTENERESHKRMHEERHRSGHGDVGKGDSELQESSEPGSSYWSSCFTAADISKSPSGSKSTGRYDKHKESRRQSEDPTLERHYSTAHASTGKEHSTKRSSRRYVEDDFYDEKDGGRGKSRKQKDHRDDSDDRWVATNSDVDSDVDTQYQRSSSRGIKLERKDNAHSDVETQYERSSSRATKLGTKVDKSSRKRKHHSENRKHSDTEEDTSDSRH